MVSFVDMIYSLQELGLADVLIPFFLTFTVVFAILAKTKIFGTDNSKRFNVIVAVVLAFAVVVPHVLYSTPDPVNPYLYTGQIDIVKVINNSLPSIGVMVIAIVMLLLLIGTFGFKWSLSDSPSGSFIIIIALASVVYIFGSAAGWFSRIYFLPDFLYDPDTQALLVTLLVFVIVVWLITKEDKEPKDKFSDKIKEYFNLEKLD